MARPILVSLGAFAALIAAPADASLALVPLGIAALRGDTRDMRPLLAARAFRPLLPLRPFEGASSPPGPPDLLPFLRRGFGRSHRRGRCLSRDVGRACLGRHRNLLLARL